jgi:hypothetical protein
LLIGKRGQRHELAFMDQASSGKPAEREPQALAKPDRGPTRTGGAEQEFDEVTRILDRWRRGFLRIERVERVPPERVDRERAANASKSLTWSSTTKRPPIAVSIPTWLQCISIARPTASNCSRRRSNTSCIAPVGEFTPWRPAVSPTSRHTLD